MSILVAYASRHGATAGIAERIAARLRAAGLEANARPISAVTDITAYDAFVIGGATYMFHWLPEATAFVRQNVAVLAGRPVWLFSSGPLGTEEVDAKGQDVRTISEAREIPALRSAIHARDHRVFFGAFDGRVKAVGFTERLALMLPAARAAFPDGDFRDWAEIEAWADGIAAALVPAPRHSSLTGARRPASAGRRRPAPRLRVPWSTPPGAAASYDPAIEVTASRSAGTT
jgi:menaquinone-dependent protoporphyrinogen oxidase